MREKKSRKVLLLDIFVMITLLFFDRFTKYLALTRLKGNPAVVLIDGVLELQYVKTTGMAFSLFQDKKIFILIMGFLVMGVILFFLFRVPEEKKFRIVHILLSALIAGALGNIIDRIRYDYVIDFISFVLIHYPVFNVADCYIVVSAIILFILFMFVYKEEELAFLSFGKKHTAD